jgi:hypothetical protein
MKKTILTVLALLIGSQLFIGGCVTTGSGQTAQANACWTKKGMECQRKAYFDHTVNGVTDWPAVEAQKKKECGC